MDAIIIVGYLTQAIIMSFIGRAIVSYKGYVFDNHGFAWGFWLGLIGIIVCASKPVYTDYRNTHYRTAYPDKGWVCNCGARNTSDENNRHRCGKQNPKTKSEALKTEPSLTDKIKEINKLKEEGLITEEEYNAKKKQILGL